MYLRVYITVLFFIQSYIILLNIYMSVIYNLITQIVILFYNGNGHQNFINEIKSQFTYS